VLENKVSNSSKLFTPFWKEYQLIDAGGGKKLERFGDVYTIRPELQAYFKSVQPFTEWEKLATYIFKEQTTIKGTWISKSSNSDNSWRITFEGLQFNLELSTFKHIGIFPEQVENWKFIQQNLISGNRFLNLFAYTGIASIVARNTGASVTHVDSVKSLVNWAKKNMEINNLSDIRWILDDALVFAQKEVKRGNKYDMLVMDPPAFGYGAKGEKWILEEKLPMLLDVASKLLNEKGILILNTYSPKLSLSDLKKQTFRFFEASKVEAKELWTKTASGRELFYGNLIRVKK
jgi:23S rRNA (cytosine1962-C5)-methyltransferase